MRYELILVAVAAFSLACLICAGLVWLLRRRGERGRLETMKAVVWFILINAVGWVWSSYLLGYLGREQIAESLSQVAITAIVAVILGYAGKALTENICKHKRKPGDVPEHREENNL